MLHRNCQECISLFLLRVLLSKQREILFGEGMAFYGCVVAGVVGPGLSAVTTPIQRIEI